MVLSLKPHRAPLAAAFAAAGIVLTVALPGLALAAAPTANQAAVTKGVNYLKSIQAADGHIGSTLSDADWAGVALNAGGSSLNAVKLTNGTDLRAYLATHAPGSTATASDWARSIITIVADGQNPYNFGGINYVAKLKSFVSNHQLGNATNPNDDYFGLMALVAAGAPATDATLTDEVADVVSYQHDDGGYSWSTDPANTSDVDDTAAAMMSLNAAKKIGATTHGLTAATAKALTYLQSLQNTNGGYPSDPAYSKSSNVSSTAWVVMAFNGFGLGNGAGNQDAQAYLRSMQLADGSFPSTYAPGVASLFDTNPSIVALAGGTWPLSVYNGTIPPTTTIASPTPTPSVPAVLGASTAATLPTVGTWANAVMVGLAGFLALVAGYLSLRRQRHRRADTASSSTGRD